MRAENARRGERGLRKFGGQRQALRRLEGLFGFAGGFFAAEAASDFTERFGRFWRGGIERFGRLLRWRDSLVFLSRFHLGVIFGSKNLRALQVFVGVDAAASFLFAGFCGVGFARFFLASGVGGILRLREGFGRDEAER